MNRSLDLEDILSLCCRRLDLRIRPPGNRFAKQALTNLSVPRRLHRVPLHLTDIDESAGDGHTFSTDGSNGTTNGDNDGAYQFRADFVGATSDTAVLAHVLDFTEPIVIDSFFVGDIDHGGDQTQIAIMRWQDTARFVATDAAGNNVPVTVTLGADLALDSLGFAAMPEDAVEQATDEDPSNWATISTTDPIAQLRVEYYRGADAGWQSFETADPDYGIPNSSSRMQIHNLAFTRSVQTEIPCGSISGTVTVDTSGDGTAESNFGGVTLHLLDSNGVHVGTAITDSNGDYVFPSVAEGDYTIVEFDPTGYSSLSDTDGGDPNSIAVTVGSSEAVTGQISPVRHHR